MVNDGHNTTVDFAGQWVGYWLAPFLDDTNLNSNDKHTMILFTFDEAETCAVNIRTLPRGAVQRVLAGPSIRPTTHYSSLSTKLESRLTRLDNTNQALSTVYSLVANATGYTNPGICLADIPLTNPPSTSTVGTGGGPVFVASGVDTSFTAAKALTPVSFTAQCKTVPWFGPRVATLSPGSPSSSGNDTASARGA
ncbi:hypothetical protein H4582DRAFT_2199088 [Lactarius indigo]|nr:hypothetical protein H4582DRAFT_2199088 [Lactarius indigo]